MENTSRNSPCPCGSGKKYKRCCLDNVIEFPKNNFSAGNVNKASEMLEIAKEDLDGRQFSFLEELNQEISIIYNKQNSLVQPEFLGLSPNHMQSILYGPFEMKNEIFEIHTDDKDVLREIPLIKQALYFLNKLSSVGEMKTTKLGNLPKSFVIELFEEFFSKEGYVYKPNKEDDLPDASKLKHLLDMSGLIKKRTNKYSLTKKGEVLLKKDNVQSLFEHLVLCIFNKWNWGYSDGYSEMQLIQSSVIFNMHLLNQKAQDWISSEELGEYYLQAFPALINQAGGYFGPEKEIIQCFSIRFLDRICGPLGLLLEQTEGEFRERKTFYKVSPFFRNSFKFTSL